MIIGASQSRVSSGLEARGAKFERPAPEWAPAVAKSLWPFSISTQDVYFNAAPQISFRQIGWARERLAFDFRPRDSSPRGEGRYSPGAECSPRAVTCWSSLRAECCSWWLECCSELLPLCCLPSACSEQVAASRSSVHQRTGFGLLSAPLGPLAFVLLLLLPLSLHKSTSVARQMPPANLRLPRLNLQPHRPPPSQTTRPDAAILTKLAVDSLKSCLDRRLHFRRAQCSASAEPALLPRESLKPEIKLRLAPANNLLPPPVVSPQLSPLPSS